MRVVILANWPEGELCDGVAYYTKNLAISLGKQDEVEVHVISFGNESKSLEDAKTHITWVKSRKIYYPFPFLALLRLFKEIERIKPDVIQVHGSNISPYILLGGLLRNKYPSILIILGLVSRESRYGYGAKNNIWPYISRFTEKYSISKFQNLVVETNSIKEVVEDQTKSKIYVSPPGIDCFKYQDIKPKSSSEKPDIFMVSKIEKLKGMDLLIQSLHTVLQSIPKLKVCIAGTGPQENELKTLVKKLNLEDHVKFLGYISEEEKFQYYKACKVVAVPSRWDCQPITLFEAAASGKVVVASNMSNPEIVIDGKTGFVFKSEDVDDLADKLTLLLKDETLRDQMSESAKERAREYEWSRTAKRFVDIYQEVIQDFHNRKTINNQI